MLAPLSLKHFRKFYKQHIARDFPPEEIPPARFLKAMLKGADFDGYTRLDEQGELEGYAILRRKPCVSFLFLYAVEPQLRGRGVGSAFMREIFELCADDDFLVLEVERPECAESEDERAVRERRIRFYEHLGYTLCRAVDYSVYRVPMWLMAKPLARAEVPSPAELAEAMRSFYKGAPPGMLTTDLI